MPRFKQISAGAAAGLGLVVVAPLLISAAEPGQIDRAALDEKQLAKLDQLLDGREATGERRCISQRLIRNVTTISNDVLVYNMRNGDVLVNQPVKGCPNLKNNTLVTNRPVDLLCKGDVATITDFRSGVTYGSCQFSMFTEYEKAEEAAD
ncbi:MAG: hypothetical protein AAFX04_14330 [Pseudomonadota bacterium]